LRQWRERSATKWSNFQTRRAARAVLAVRAAKKSR
jgi:hypothetical protein